MRLPLTFVCVLALCLSAPPTTEAKSRKKTKTKSAAAKKAHIEQAAPSQKDVAESSEHIQRMKDARANKDAEKYEQMEAACKANPRDADLARKASYMYYHAARPAQAVKHFDRVRIHEYILPARAQLRPRLTTVVRTQLNMLVGFKKNPHTKKLAPTDHGGMIDMYARLDRVEDAQAHWCARDTSSLPLSPF